MTTDADNTLQPQDLHWDAAGLIPVAIQDADSGLLLTLAYMNPEALERSLRTGEVWLWSRKRRRLWHKGETSGNTQAICEVRVDCDADALLVRVRPAGPACHTGEVSCFYRTLVGECRARDEERM